MIFYIYYNRSEICKLFIDNQLLTTFVTTGRDNWAGAVEEGWILR